MSTLYITHDAFLHHDTGYWHPERAERLRAVEKALSIESFQNLQREQAPMATREQILRVHPERYIAWLEKHRPASDLIAIDGDTIMSPGSWEAALRGVGAAVYAVDEVMTGRAGNVFCAVRPPGHHAEPERAMGFCLFSNVAIAAFHAQKVHGAERVAVIDFDVHHGNGTQAAFWSHPSMFYASTHEMPLFPGTGKATERGVANNILNVPLKAGDDGRAFRAAYESIILPGLRSHRPDLILISAGFDGHKADPLANLRLEETDFAWVTRELNKAAAELCEGRVVSMLEGGYDLDALGKSVAVHVIALMEAQKG